MLYIYTAQYYIWYHYTVHLIHTIYAILANSNAVTPVTLQVINLMNNVNVVSYQILASVYLLYIKIVTAFHQDDDKYLHIMNKRGPLPLVTPPVVSDELNMMLNG